MLYQAKGGICCIRLKVAYVDLNHTLRVHFRVSLIAELLHLFHTYNLMLVLPNS